MEDERNTFPESPCSNKSIARGFEYPPPRSKHQEYKSSYTSFAGHQSSLDPSHNDRVRCNIVIQRPERSLATAGRRRTGRDLLTGNRSRSSVDLRRGRADVGDDLFWMSQHALGVEVIGGKRDRAINTNSARSVEIG
jgi:hypothetical protein